MIWLSQYTAVGELPNEVRRRVLAFWDSVYSFLQREKKPTLLLNLPPPAWLEEDGINSDEYLAGFLSAVTLTTSGCASSGSP